MTRMKVQPAPALAAALLFALSLLRAENLTVTLPAGQTVEVVVDSPVDDENYRDPRGYEQHGAQSRGFLRKLTLTNTGSIPLTGARLVIDGRDWSRPEALPFAPGPITPQLYNLWRDHLSHADSDAPGAKEPLALLNFWGYALCGDATAAVTHLASARGVPTRKIPLNGHVAAEHFYDGAWRIFDTDQNVFYLHLDNRTLASAADLRADPLLARRTKAFGRHAAMDPVAAAYNTSLHEFIAPEEGKAIKVKTAPAAVREATLFAGEKMIVHAQQSPEIAVGRTELNRWGRVREEALRVVEYTLNLRTRPTTTDQSVSYESGYPILRAVNRTAGETISVPPADPIFEVTVPFRSADDQISIFCQRSNATLPRLHNGRNSVLLATNQPVGSAQLSADWIAPAPSFIVPRATARLADAAPTFEVNAEPTADSLWWQIAPSNDFAFVAPNFDAVTAFTPRVTFDLLTGTFFNPDTIYFFRVKVRADGVWSEWSALVKFQVTKPPRPAPAQATVAANRLRVTWPDAGEGAEYQVFGSNRRDFLPETFAAEEIVKLRNQGVEESRPNKNLVAVVTRPEIELEPTFRFYRVVTRRSGALSVPGDLISTPPELAANLSPALILQDRWQRVDGRDEHLATEMPLPAR